MYGSRVVSRNVQAQEVPEEFQDPTLMNAVPFADMTDGFVAAFPTLDRATVHDIVYRHGAYPDVVLDELLRASERKESARTLQRTGARPKQCVASTSSHVCPPNCGMPMDTSGEFKRVSGDYNLKEFLSQTELLKLRVDMVQDMLPDADPQFLEQEIKKLGGDEMRISDWIDQMLITKKYPKFMDFLKGREIGGVIESHKTMTASEFLRGISEPEKVYSRKDRIVTEQYKQLCRAYLYLLYPSRKAEVNNSMIKNNSLLFPSIILMEQWFGPQKYWTYEFFQADGIVDVTFIQEFTFMRLRHEIATLSAASQRQRMEILSEARANGALYKCEVCFDEEFTIVEVVQCGEQGHTFCITCVQKHAEVCATEKRSKVNCLHPKCPGSYSLSDIFGLLPENLFGALLREDQNEQLRAAGLQELVECPFCSFGAVVEDKTMTEFQCLNPGCGKRSCIACKKTHSPTDMCKVVQRSAQKLMEEKLSEAVVRSCPWCKKSLVKADGCNHMSCRCGKSFCYLCRKPLHGENPCSNARCREFVGTEEIHNIDRQNASVAGEREIRQRYGSVQGIPDELLKHLRPVWSEDVAETCGPIVVNIVRSFAEMKLVWDDLGLSMEDQRDRKDRFAKNIKRHVDDMRKGENSLRARIIQENVELGREIDRFYDDLDADIQPDDKVLVLKTKLEKEVNRLVALKEKMLEDLILKKNEERLLCDELGMPPLPISADKVPTEQDMKDLDSQISMLKKEKISRTQKFELHRSKIIDLWDQLGLVASGGFESDITQSTMILSKENLEKMHALESDLLAKLDLAELKFAKLKREIELLWDLLERNDLQVNLFRDKHFGIREENFTEMEAELEKLLGEKLEKIAFFITKMRTHIKDMCDSLMYGPATTEAIESMLPRDDPQGELDQLEEIQEQLCQELTARQPVLVKVRKWLNMVADFSRLQSESMDPRRLNNRGGALLQLEKEKSKLSKGIPELAQKLKSEIGEWETSHGKDFKVMDERFMDKIEDHLKSVKLAPASARKPISSCNTTLKRPANVLADGSTVKRPRIAGQQEKLPQSAPRVGAIEETIASVDDFHAFQIGISSATKVRPLRRGDRLVQHRMNLFSKQAGRTPLNELAGPALDGLLTSTQLESPSKRRFPKIGDEFSREVT
ncbi:unnamed protein product [Notodromas monacha]|uniref:RING-type domain-containing protein n=1 Tax=Notodromas monacha TaxID=399045 RepID=A0A7R9BHS9_9CRUS|nr:unnamed protein product [Notodromas monacha]CAG0914972.1 unnamed protein product [Notodromas monacha]